jgi:hypothetical protein
MGANLTQQQALEIALEAVAKSPFHPLIGNLNGSASAYSLVEQSVEVQPNGRADHSFQFERSPVQLKEGRYRLLLQVKGDALTTIRHSFKTPESFKRQFSGMRSGNEAIAQVAWIAIAGGYGLLGVGTAVFHLLRRKALLATSALWWAAGVASLATAAQLCDFPLTWIQYKTSVGLQLHYMTFAVNLIASLGLYTVILWASFMAAEGLSRLTRPNQLQLWTLFSQRQVLGSPEVLQQIMRGYCYAPVLFAYEVVFYFLCSKYLHWWTPSSALLDPDIPGAWIPWLKPFALSLFAGFWEECLFRAVPLGGALLWTGYYVRPGEGKDKDKEKAKGEAKGEAKVGTVFGAVVMALAFIMQAVIFGSAHANYPAQPSYARLVELLLPSVGFGALYINEGLLPAVICHFIYDLVWMSLPLFLTDGLLDRVMVIMLGVMPIVAALVSSFLLKGSTEHALGVTPFLNKSWQPSSPTSSSPEQRSRAESSEQKNALSTRPPAVRAPTFVWLLLSLAGGAILAEHLLLGGGMERPAVPGMCDGMHLADASHQSQWVGHVPAKASLLLAEASHKPDVAPGAAAAAAAELAVEFDQESEISGAPPWRRLPMPATSDWREHRFIWREHHDQYVKLVRCGYLPSPRWRVRFARFPAAIPSTDADGGGGDGGDKDTHSTSAPADSSVAQDDGAESSSRASALGIKASTEHAELAEEWAVTFQPANPSASAGAGADAGEDCGGGDLFREWEEGAQIFHKLPEARTGRNLTETDARAFATKIMEGRGYRVQHDDEEQTGGTGGMVAREKKARPIKHPQRVDWEFQFSCSGNRSDGADTTGTGTSTPLVLSSGDARVSIVLGAATLAGTTTSSTTTLNGGDAGDPTYLHLHAFRRWVKVPEAWVRHDENEQQAIKLLRAVSNLMTMLCVLIGAGFGLYRWATDTSQGSEKDQKDKKRIAGGKVIFPSRTFVYCFVLVLALHFCNGINRWPGFAADMRTAQPVSNQLVSHVGSSVVKALLHAVVLGLALALAHCQLWRGTQQPVSGEGSHANILYVGMSAICIGSLPSVGERIVEMVLTMGAEGSAEGSAEVLSLAPAECDVTTMSSWSTAGEMAGR